MKKYLLTVLCLFAPLLALLPYGSSALAVEVLRDCPNCPELVVIPPGKFMMGSSPEDIKKYLTLSTAGDEGPQRQVHIAKAFALGKFEVTRGEYAAFVRETNYVAASQCTIWTGKQSAPLVPTPGMNWEHNPVSSGDRDPVVCLTYADMSAYLEWLSRKTGYYYRFPSEAEWEYAARAGSTGLYFFGEDPAELCKYGNTDDLTVKEEAEATGAYAPVTPAGFAPCHDGYGVRTAPVGRYKPNAFGLYDTIGNVWERVEDCYHESYQGGPTDGSPWLNTGLRSGIGIPVDCNYRVVRGSGWRNAMSHFRSANRYGNYPVYFQGDYVGFRVARSVAMSPAKAASTSATARVATAAKPSSCTALTSADFSRITDAPAQIEQSSIKAAAGKVPAHCAVQARVATRISLSMALPEASAWNGKITTVDGQFAHVGCEQDCGAAFSLNACQGPLRKGYACMAVDVGHQAVPLDLHTASSDRPADLDLAFRAVHLATVAGKAIAASHYSRPVAKSYFLGCSTGGRQGLIAAQRFPDDYDGIVAGAPATHLIGNALAVLWNANALLDANGQSLFDLPAERYLATDFQLLHKAILAQCDMDDGVSDGIIGDPRACRFDPATLQCAGAKTAQCLNAAQVNAIRKIFSGPASKQGRSLFAARAMPGSEVNWAYSYLAPATIASARQVDWERDPQRLKLRAALFDAANPDLRAFKARGGKLLIFHGWSDHEVLPESSIDYYESVTRTMGSAEATRDFFRLFMIPGMDHCGNGVAADKVDYLSALEAWVEQGKPPEKLIAARVKDARIWPADAGYWGHEPWDAKSVVFTRPILPYPARAKYAGKGDSNSATNFTAN